MLPKVKNTLSIKKLFGYRFLVLDTEEMLWSTTGRDSGIDIKVEQTWKKDSFKYILRFVTIRKKDLSVFEKVSAKVTNKMILCGYTDYEKYGKEVENLEADKPFNLAA